MKACIVPSFKGEDQGDGGVRRVVEAQNRYLPKFGIELTNNPDEADVLSFHIQAPPHWLTVYPRKPLVAFIHGLYWSEYVWEHWAIKANAEVMDAIRAADIVTAPSEWVAQTIRRHTMRDVRVVHHGIDMAEWEPGENKGYVLWNKTRPDAVCDPQPMNDAAVLLPNIAFLSTFGNQAPNVTLTGKLPYETGKQLIRSAGVYLCTARETFGIGTLEAMAAGVPVVALNWGGQAEFLTHKVDGWLANTTEELAEGIEWALANREKVAKAARKTVTRFSWEAAAKKYAEIYEELLSRYSVKGPRTSVIVTAYKLEEYLPDALESVFAQADSDWECIVVDDASPDICGAIAEEFAARDGRFKVIHNKSNQYLAEARNTGIAAAQGRYILPLDADDWLAPNAVKILADALDQDKSLHVAYGNVEFVEPDGKHWHSSWPMQFAHEQQIMQRNLLPYSSMYRREAWRLTGGYRPRCRTAEDADFWTRLSSYGFRPRMVTEADTLIYRNREGSMSRREALPNWINWFPWGAEESITPAGAVTRQQLPIEALEPPYVSVVIPVGPGHERLAMDAVDSVDAQFYRAWECIVINDTGKPLPYDMPSWVRVIETKGQEGVAAARNKGIAAAKGQVFLPLDADDYLQPEALGWLVRAHQDTGDVIYSDFWQEISGSMTIHECDDYDPYLLKGSKRIRLGEEREGMIHSCFALTPKKAWEAVGGYDESLPGWEDWDFQLAIADKGVCSRRIAAPLFVYRKHTGSRREKNYADFEKSKDGIYTKWQKLWDGGQELMACRTCGSKGTVNPYGGGPVAAQFQSSAEAPPSNGEAVLVTYVGNQAGAKFIIKGASGAVYRFRANEPPRYVLRNDLDIFKGRLDFQVESDNIQRPTAQSNGAPAPAPVLVAAGPPAEEELAPEIKFAQAYAAPDPDIQLPAALPPSPGAISVDQALSELTGKGRGAK